MKLLYQTHSPFARKALVFAHEAGWAGSLEVIHHETSPTNQNKEVFALNPLGKVPVLIVDGEKAIFDSTVICTYLDVQAQIKGLIPTGTEERIASLRLNAVADGLSEAGILVRWEADRRPEQFRYQPFHDGQLDKVLAGYEYLENEVVFDETVTIGEIALATSLSWLEFRGLPPFRGNFPKLTSWYDAFSKRPSMLATNLSGDTQD